MGFFSWKTADTDETIWNRYAANDYGVPLRTTYLLQPDAAPIVEPCYKGYGDFGGIDAYNWLARRNIAADKLVGLTEDQIRGLGVSLDCGSYHVDAETGQTWSIFDDGLETLVPDIRHFAGTFGQIIPEFGLSGNDLIASGRFVAQGFGHLVTTPLKFSFDRHADYAALPPSPQCRSQGFFVGWETDEDEEGDAIH